MNQSKKIYQSDVAIVGGGLAGLVTAFELLDQNQSVIILDRDVERNLGGLAKKSFGGIMLVDTPHQRKMGIKDTPELALSDWYHFAHFGDGDIWPQAWAKCYVEHSIDGIFEWLTSKSVSFLPVVNWPERGLFQPGNSIPRWHIAWGTGHAIIESILKHLNTHPNRHKLTIHYQHQVNEFLLTNGRVSGCSGIIERTDEVFETQSNQVVLASGGICGGDLSKVKRNWYTEWGKPPETLLNGSHRFADGKLHGVVAQIGGNVTHLDKQWHYAAGIHHPHPEQEREGLSLVPPRSALWMDATGKRFGPLPLMGYTDTRYVVEQICRTPDQYSWLILNWKIAIKELAVSGCDYMTAFRNKDKLQLAKNLLTGDKALVNRLIQESDDFVVANSVGKLSRKMEALSLGTTIDADQMAADIKAYDDQIDRGRKFFNDDQLRRIANFRDNRGDRLRMCKFQKIDDPKARPLIAIRSFILSRKSLGGVQTNLESQVLDAHQRVIPGLYAVGETAGFGGGGIHGLGSLEGTFLGSCVLTGRIAALSIVGKKL